MVEKSHEPDSPQGGRERSQRGILQSTKRVRAPLDEQLPPGSEEEGQRLPMGEHGPWGYLKPPFFRW